MIDSVDRALEALLSKQTPTAVSFEPPDSDGVLPRVNLFLFDIRENVKLREDPFQTVRSPGDRRLAKKRSRVRMDLTYLVTAHAESAQAEHRLLSDALKTFMVNPTLDHALFKDDSFDREAFLEVAQPEQSESYAPSAIWNSIRSRIRPSLTLKVTAIFDPFLAEEVPAVREVLVGLGWMHEGGLPGRPTDVVRIGVSALGFIRNAEGKPIENATVSVRNYRRSMLTGPDGLFYFTDLPKGNWMIDIEARGFAANYIEVKAPTAGRVDELVTEIVTLVRESDQVDATQEARLVSGGGLASRIPRDVERNHPILITGRLRFPNGESGKYIPLRLGVHRTVSDEEGRYRFPFADGKIVATVPGVGDVPIDCVAGAADIPAIPKVAKEKQTIG